MIKIAFAPGYSLFIRMDTSQEALSWLGILIFSISSINNFENICFFKLRKIASFTLQQSGTKNGIKKNKKS
jgi:hypothetical protein